jgi:DNA-binding transcriptional ArsR family regulator
MINVSKEVELLRTLADPLRLGVLQRLMQGGATVSELVAQLGVSQPNASNHLAILRKAGLVQARKAGRQMVYAVAHPSLIEVIDAVTRAVGRRGQASRPATGLVTARTCYDHLAGKLGVALFDVLVERQALRPSLGGSSRERKVRSGLGAVALGLKAEAVFSRLGIDLDRVRLERRQFATACLDWTENRPHLGGALGAALWARFLEKGWVARQADTRAVLLTRQGRGAIARLV